MRHSPHHHRPPTHVGPEWIVAVHDDALTRSDYAALLRSLADAVDEGGRIEIDDVVIEMPGTVEVDLRFERTPHGTRALLVRAEWAEQAEAVITVGSTRSLRIRPVPGTSSAGGAP